MRDVPLIVTGFYSEARPANERSLFLRAKFDWNPELWRRPKNDLWLYADLQQPGTAATHDLWAITLWPIPLLLWTPAALLLRSGIVARRRALTGTCLKCGYSLAGLSDNTPCPECGKGAKATE